MSARTVVVHVLLATFAVASAFAADDGRKASELKVSLVRYLPEQRAVLVRFENDSQRPLNLLKPLDGSHWGWHMPVYEVSMKDRTGREVPLAARCKMSGLYSDMKWPNDYQIQIPPGDAYEMPVDIARATPLTGRFTVRLRYTYDPAVKTPRHDPRIKYPDDLWVGSISSAPIEIELPGEQ